MKYTLRFLIFSVCLLTSVSALADQRGADLFKPASNRTSPAQWNASSSGTSFSYSRNSSSYYGQSVYGRNIYGSTDNNAISNGVGREMQYATNDFIDGNNDGQSGPQLVKRGAFANPGTPVGDAIPFVVVLAVAFAAYKSRKRIAAFLMR